MTSGRDDVTTMTEMDPQRIGLGRGTRMDLRALRRLCRGGESETLEFKRTTGELKKAMRTLCAFLNTRGGRVLFGVTDDGDVRGQHVGKGTLESITDALRLFWPRAAVRIERIPMPDGKQVIMLTVARGEDAPYTFDGVAYHRVRDTTRRVRARVQRHGFTVHSSRFTVRERASGMKVVGQTGDRA
ncbi:MAG: ATP-binding protein [Planctomycetes bacterium]|nr:ATP-binding protein [Planctomycetota bacterium]